MNAAVVRHGSSAPGASATREGEPRWISQPSEWIDPEGDDWLADIYRELTRDSIPGSAAAGPLQSELEHWFG